MPDILILIFVARQHCTSFKNMFFVGGTVPVDISATMLAFSTHCKN
jgi:hypothetical protein